MGRIIHMEKAKRVADNPFDRITEDDERGERVPIGLVRTKREGVKARPPRKVYKGPNGDEEFIYF
jgi:hypothetical protein